MKGDLSHKHACFLAPPFLSHLTPMISLAQSLFSSEVEVTIGCSDTFQSLIEGKGFNFTEIRINLNANKGSATDTEQMESEKQRLDDFFEATRKGPVETLSLQMRHRGKDMFANPAEVFQRIQEIDIQIKPDIWVIDQLSYSVTVSLMALKLPFISFCPPHPASIPEKDRVYGIPLTWPEQLKPEPMQLKKLIRTAKEAESDFDREVNAFLEGRGFPSLQIKRTFTLSSPLAIVFNYPDFKKETHRNGPLKLYMGFSFLQEPLSEEWKEILSHKKGKIVFLSLGTFLSARDDVLKRTIESIQEYSRDILIIAAAGGSVSKIEHLRDENTMIEDFLPLKALLPCVDVVIHHGGVGTFTESLYFSKPAIVMPFSSDQFNVAADVEQMNLGVVLDPNHFTNSDLASGLDQIFKGIYKDSVNFWSREIR